MTMAEAAVSPRLEEELTRGILTRTDRRVRNLTVEILPDGVVLHGQTASWYVKQLAQHSVSILLPRVDVRNAISVDERR